MAFACFEDPRINGAIERFGTARKMSFLVGAGASMEAGLASWDELVRRLLIRAGRDAGLFAGDDEGATSEALDEWAQQILNHESLSGAASVAEQLLGERLPTVLREELYRRRDGQPAGPQDYRPGPIANEVAHCRETMDLQRNKRLRILTTNYDDLLLQALRERPTLSESYSIYPRVYPPEREPDDPLKVRHLHGYLGPDGDRGEVVLTDVSYYRETGVSKDRCVRLGSAGALNLWWLVVDERGEVEALPPT
jgi:hypothetical protein